MKNYELHITKECNWNCSYCGKDSVYKNEAEWSSETVLVKIFKLPNNSTLYISGGEPGLADSKLIERIFQICKLKKIKIKVFTNGLFILNFSKYLKDITEIILHISENLELNDESEKYIEDILTIFNSSKSELNLITQLIITDENYKNLDSFLTFLKNKKIKNILPLPSKNYEEDENVDKVILSPENYEKILKILNKYKDNLYPNFEQFFKNDFYESLSLEFI